MYLCPRCDIGLSSREAKEGKCNNCNLEFKPPSRLDNKDLSESILLEKFEQEVKNGMNYKRVNYYKTLLNFVKAYLPSIVCIQNLRHCNIYMVDDAEIVAFLFRLTKTKTKPLIEFDITLKKFSQVKVIPESARERTRFAKYLKSRLDTTDLEYIMNVIKTVYDYKRGAVNKNRKVVKPTSKDVIQSLIC